ncbi:Nitrate reductase [NADH] [Rhizoctonia solani]|uniref:Nitrate reductase [NADH] n=1 Tax=Rhizoctonia solani TaxID=456999 RepID=A0A0K6G4R1_9AGAM|nr:Nitrate reductase [NADH] [Rhizoctonia solani]
MLRPSSQRRASYSLNIRSDHSNLNHSTTQSDTNVTPEEFDDYGAELQPNARVWKAYMNEADNFDKEKVEGWKNSLDVTLIFATLFTAICTTFVVDSAKSLQEDTAKTAARRLDQITQILLVVANVSDPRSLDPTALSAPISPDPFKPRGVDVWVNALWFFSLILSAAVALLAILAKEWCYLFMSERSGNLWGQTKTRQQRWRGIEMWGMENLIIILPSFVHLSFISFAIGLCIYLGDLNWRVAILVSIVTLGSVVAYAASTILPFLAPSDTICPYSTSISRLARRIKEGIQNTPKPEDEQTSRIALEALAWLIKNSENSKTTDTALQAIAGADPDIKGRELLKNCEADKMVSGRLIGLDPYSRNHERISELYTRALSFFSPISARDSASRDQENLNKVLQKKIRTLQDLIKGQILKDNSSDGFLPTSHHIEALRIGSTAASHCLRTLTQGGKTQTEQQFGDAIKLLEGYRNRQHLNDREIDYLMKGTAMLLLSLLIDTTAGIRGEHILKLLRLARRVEEGEKKGQGQEQQEQQQQQQQQQKQKQLRLGYLGLPMIVYALSRHDYPGWTQPPDASSMSRAKRATEVITHYCSEPKELPKVAALMTNLGLLELLSDQREHGLEDEDITTISEAFDPNACGTSGAHIYTFPENSHPYVSSRTIQSIATMVSSEQKGILSKETVATAFLTVLNRTGVDCSLAGTSSVEVYAFVIECVLTLSSSTTEAYGPKSALDLMQKFHDSNPRQTRIPITDLVECLRKREIFKTLKSGTELDVTSSESNFKSNFDKRLFATGQAWYLVDLVIKSGVTDKEDWTTELNYFVEAEGLWDISDTAIGGSIFEEWKKKLAKQFNDTWKINTIVRRHPYLETLNKLLPWAGGGQGDLLATSAK